MTYNCTHKELRFIENAEIKDGTSKPYISAYIDDEYHYLSSGGVVVTMGHSTKVLTLYYTNTMAAEKALDKFKKDREVIAGEKEKKPLLISKKTIKRMSAEEFAGALKDI